MIRPEYFYDLLQKRGSDFFTGVPDSLLKNFCAYVTDTVPEDKHIIAANEGCALARKCTKRHGIVRNFLLKIGVSEKTAMIDSEGLEHHISSETLECMKNFIAER